MTSAGTGYNDQVWIMYIYTKPAYFKIDKDVNGFLNVFTVNDNQWIYVQHSVKLMWKPSFATTRKLIE